jgi:hypothetical protein
LTGSLTASRGGKLEARTNNAGRSKGSARIVSSEL